MDDPLDSARSLADALPDGVVMADAAGLVTLVSARAAQMLGTAPETAGVALADVLLLQDNEGRAWTSCNQPYAGLTTRSAIPEQSWQLPDGTEVLVAARLHRSAPGGPPTSVAVTLRSGRGRARLDRERSDLVATVAHELRSPLTGVRGFVRALLHRWDKLTDDQKKLMLTTVSVDADRLSRLIAELLDVARIDTGRLQLHARPIEAGRLAERVVASASAGTSRTITLEVADDAPQILVDPDKFIQVVTNLVENALKHGSGRVAVVVDAPSAPEQRVRLTVADEGAGIPVELRRRVFTKFWTGSTHGGSGLGLYIAHGLARAHGGEVLIDDAPGGGALITCTWPVADV